MIAIAMGAAGKQQNHRRGQLTTMVVKLILLASIWNGCLAWGGTRQRATTLPSSMVSTAANSRLFSPVAPTPSSSVQRKGLKSVFDSGRDTTKNGDDEETRHPTALGLMRGGTDDGQRGGLYSQGRQLLAEFFGTYLLVQIGCGVVCSSLYLNSMTGLGQIASVWAVGVTLAIYATGHISGAHLNPAITLALAMVRGFRWGKVIPYWFAQVCGAATAGWVNWGLFGGAIAKFERSRGITRGTAASVLSASGFGQYWSVGTWECAFLAEMLGTGILSFFIFALSNPRNDAVPNKAVPPLIGATVGCLIAVLAPLTQGGFNPARDLGPRLVTSVLSKAQGGWGSVAMEGWWVYVLAPLVGAPIGAKIADRVLWKDNNVDNYYNL